MDFTTFNAKYGDSIPGISATKFELFLPQVSLEISKNNWGELAGIAAEMKMGCLLIQTSPAIPGASEIPSNGIKSINYDGELSITYDSQNKAEGCWFCQEYDRLLSQIKGIGLTALSEKRGTHYGGDRADSQPLNW